MNEILFLVLWYFKACVCGNAPTRDFVSSNIML